MQEKVFRFSEYLVKSSDPFKESLGVEMEVPIGLASINALNKIACEYQSKANERLIELILLEQNSGSDKTPIELEIRKLNLKMDYLIGLSSLGATGDETPRMETTKLYFCSHGVRLANNWNMEQGQEVNVHMSLSTQYSRPLVIAGAVVDLDEGTSIKFGDISETLSELLDKYVFRIHRHRIAVKRTGAETAGF